MRHTKVALSAALALAVAAGAAGAQSSTRPFSLGISGGPSFPTGDAGDGLNTGFIVAGHLGIQPSVSPIGFRLDLGYNRWEVDGADANLRAISGTANAMLMFPTATGSSVRPYLSGGVGLYNTKGSVDVGDRTVSGDSETNFGLNAGAGIDFGLSGLSTFVELRFHSIFTEERNTNYVPVVFGVRF
jgi:opacity protein-like surface antigen